MSLAGTAVWPETTGGTTGFTATGRVVVLSAEEEFPLKDRNATVSTKIKDQKIAFRLETMFITPNFLLESLKQVSPSTKMLTSVLSLASLGSAGVNVPGYSNYKSLLGLLYTRFACRN